MPPARRNLNRSPEIFLYWHQNWCIHPSKSRCRLLKIQDEVLRLSCKMHSHVCAYVFFKLQKLCTTPLYKIHPINE